VSFYANKVKCTLVQALRFCAGCMVHRWSRNIALLLHDHGTRRGWAVSVTPRSLIPPGKNPVPIVQETGWAPGQVWTGAENLAHTVIRSPDRPVRIKSLCRLSYPAHVILYNVYIISGTEGISVKTEVMQLSRSFLTNMWCRGLQVWSKLFLAHPLFDRVKVGNISVICSDYCRGTEQGICLSCISVDKHIFFL
jgi:hypothetical protein